MSKCSYVCMCDRRACPAHMAFLTSFICSVIVTFGASLNMAGATLLMSYATGLVLQLRKPDSEISVDTSDESWIAAMPAISGLLGSSLMSAAMSRIGRRISQIASIVIMILGWLTIVFAKDITVILIGRFIHGISMGASIVLTPILTAEYSSPRYRGTFMMLTTFLSGINCLICHTTGLYLNWRTNAIICTVISVINILIALYSPESPSWLAVKHRYDDCRYTFRWLRGNDEEDELENMIKASESRKFMKEDRKSSGTTIRKKLIEIKIIVMKKELYKPIFIMLHVYTAGLWAGSYLLTTYVFDIIENTVGEGYNDQVLGLNIHRLLGGFVALYLISKTKRRTLFLTLTGLNVAVLLAIAAYTFAKTIGILSHNFPIIGVILLHFHMFVVSTCTLPMPFVICGEIYPLKYKSIASGICCTFLLISTGIYVKSFPFLLSSLSLHGAYTLYSGLIAYCLLIVYFYLPETKDRTLQEIEEEITGIPLTSDLKSVQSLINKPNSDSSNT